MSDAPAGGYPARLEIDYPESLNRLTTLLRPILAIPIFILASLLAAVVIPTVLMLLFRRKYPRWWFDFNVELARFQGRVNAYAWLLTDQYPSTDEQQSVHLEVDYPDAATELSRWLPLVKWLLALPHYIVLALFNYLTILVVLIAWVAILVTGRYPRALFNLMVGYGRWNLRVGAYTTLLVTDRYPPFRLGA